MPTRRRFAAAPVVASIVLALASCGDEEVTVPVALEDYSFRPETIVVEAGTTLAVTNVGQEPHDLVVDRAGRGTADLGPGDAQQLPLDGVAAGTYRIYCSIPGHVDLGMVGELTIT